MNLKSASHLSIFTALLIGSVSALADSPTIPCPAVNLVTAAWQLLDSAIPDNRSYIVTTSQPALTTDGRAWFLRTIIPARNEHEAIKLAQLTVRDTQALMTPNAIKILNSYGCTYFSARAFVYAHSGANYRMDRR